MNKELFLEILQSAIFSFEGMKEKEIVEKIGVDLKIVRVGIKLCDYLKGVELIR